MIMVLENEEFLAAFKSNMRFYPLLRWLVLNKSGVGTMSIHLFLATEPKEKMKWKINRQNTLLQLLSFTLWRYNELHGNRREDTIRTRYRIRRAINSIIREFYEVKTEELKGL